MGTTKPFHPEDFNGNVFWYFLRCNIGNGHLLIGDRQSDLCLKSEFFEKEGEIEKWGWGWLVNIIYSRALGLLQYKKVSESLFMVHYNY